VLDTQESPRGNIPVIIAVAAGKGGTGKTLFSTSLALALAEGVPDQVDLIDCDVEEPNADLLVHPYHVSREQVTILVPEVDRETCTLCGACARNCQFSAIAVLGDQVLTFPELCSGCGVCSYVCPVDAIREIPRQVGVVDVGYVQLSGGKRMAFVQGRMNVGEQRAPSTINAAKAHINPEHITVLDSAPGTACPMQETIEGTDVCLLVTEPTPFGLHDMAMAVDTCRRMGVPAAVVLNREGIADSKLIEDYCRREGLDLLMRIPHRRDIAEAYSRGETLLSAWPQARQGLLDVYEWAKDLMAGETGAAETAQG